jgi:hypothetical protein
MIDPEVAALLAGEPTAMERRVQELEAAQPGNREVIADTRNRMPSTHLLECVAVNRQYVIKRAADNKIPRSDPYIPPVSP